MKQDPCPEEWFTAFLGGIRKHEPLLAMLMARVAPESAVVAAATLGLLEQEALAGIGVSLEGRVASVRRIDMIVSSESQLLHAFEWKVLWQLGLSECVQKIQVDLKKLQPIPRSAVVVFAYAVTKAPPSCKGRVTSTALSTTVEQACQKLGQPLRRSKIQNIETEQFAAQYQLLAWASSPE